MKPTIPDELHVKILKRLPPCPQTLVRASAVCKEWRRIVNEPRFLQGYRAHHRAPLTMGFFHNSISLPHQFVHTGDAASFSFQQPSNYNEHHKWTFRDCRHSRVLLIDSAYNRNGYSFIVWHPMTDDRRLVDVPLDIQWSNKNSNVALLSTDDNSHDAESQGRSSFRLAIVSTNSRGQASAGVFSSLAGGWRKPRSVELPSTCHIRVEPCAIVGNTMYQPLYDYRVLAYDVDSQTLATFDRPRGGNIRLMKADGGTNLGLVAAKGLNLHLWVRDATAAVWLPRSTIALGELITGLSRAPLPHTDSHFIMMPPVKIIGVAEEGDAMFLWTMVGIYMICPNSMVFRKVHEVAENMEIVYPYAAFYLPSAAISKEAWGCFTFKRHLSGRQGDRPKPAHHLHQRRGARMGFRRR